MVALIIISTTFSVLISCLILMKVTYFQRLYESYETALNKLYGTELNQLKQELSVPRQQLEQMKEVTQKINNFPFLE